MDDSPHHVFMTNTGHLRTSSNDSMDQIFHRMIGMIYPVAALSELHLWDADPRQNESC